MSIVRLPIAIDHDQIAKFCREHQIRKLSLFGSVLRDDFDPERSDVDVLVEFLPEHVPCWEFYRWHEELALIFGRNVDLHTSNSISPYFRKEVLAEALTVYEHT
jgi:predicted nucleotidyltransferase